MAHGTAEPDERGPSDYYDSSSPPSSSQPTYMTSHSRSRASLVSAIALACTLAIVPFVAAQDRHPFVIQDGDRVLFLGDSNTQAGTYVVYLDAYVRTRFPDRSIELINHGMSSETINGMSEDDHPGKRPWVHDRLERDALAWKPTILSVCYGMNDGNYFPMHPERFEKFKEGYIRFMEIADQAKIPRVYVLTPPPFDAYRRKGDEKAVDYGYKFPAVDYDLTLAAYSDWLIAQRGAWAEKYKNVHAIDVDLHSSLNELLRQRRQGDVNYSFSGDAVHPDATGHLLIAMNVLDAWSYEPLGFTYVDVEGDDAKSGSATVTIPLPMPRDSRWDAKMVELCGWSDALTTFEVASHSRDGKWKLTVAGRPAGDAGDPQELFAGEFTGEELFNGVKLNADEWAPMQEPRAKVLANVQKRCDLVYQAWRKEIAAGGDGQASVALPELAAIDAEIARDARPWSVLVEIERLP